MELINTSLYEQYKELCEKYKNVINEYFCNDAKKLHQMVDKVIKKLNFYDVDIDEYYSLAHEIFLYSLKDYDDTQSFYKFMYSCLYKKFCTNMTMDNRDKRKNKVKVKREDENGNIIIEKIEVPDISFDAPLNEEDGIDLREKFASDFNIEDESTLDFQNDEKVEIFLNSLSNIQRKIIDLKMSEYSVEKIKQILGLSDSEYNTEMKSIQMNENLSLFSKNINDCNYKEETQVERVMEINEADNYRMDKRSMFSLLEDKKSGDINCKYILQRKPFQWTQEERNRYICRILSNLPIPEIILCEQNVKGMMIAHLIDGLQRLSYAEAFKENRFKIGANGAERHLIKYRDFLVDENGTRILDEDGIPVYEEKICDVVGKHYKDLPNELKKRFNNFNVNVTKFFNCTDEQIADHIRDYNNHTSMNNEQLGMTKISADTARKIKEIAEKNTFFKNCGKFTDITSVKGKLDRIVTESIMLLFHRDEWKSKIDKAYQYIDDNATDEEFLSLNSDLNRLEIAIGEDNKEIKKMFTVTNTPIWLAVFHEFTTYNIEDSKFIDFLRAYNNELNQKEIDGVRMSDFKDMQSKKKATITGKIELLVKLMKEYLHIEIGEETTDPETFISEMVDIDKEALEEDMDLYIETLDGEHGLKEECIKVGSKLLDEQNRLSLLAMVVYSYKEGVDLDDWMREYSVNNNTYFADQKRNYLYMLNDFNSYRKKMGVA